MRPVPCAILQNILISLDIASLLTNIPVEKSKLLNKNWIWIVTL